MKKILILIGPKGSGKTFLGMLIEKHFGIRFLRVEDWAKNIKGDRRVDNDEYVREVFEHIEKGIRASLNHFDEVVFESTGLSVHFDRMLDNLKADFNTVTVKILSDLKVCSSRIKSRDQSIHINVSDDQVNVINKAVSERNYPTDFVVENTSRSIDELVADFERIISRPA